MVKVCTKCKIKKELTEFSKDKNSKDGYYYSCKSCCKEYHQANKEYSKEYYQANKEYSKEYQK
jgi:hypothetical protein